MSDPKNHAGRALRRWLTRAILAACLVAAIAGYRAWNRPPKPTLAGLATVPVRRADFGTTILAGGQTESASNTVVECELERLEMRNEGRSSMIGGSSVITWVIDDGSNVKKGDVLCRLDASEYEELVRQQEIKVERAHADLRTADLDHQVAVMAVTEFRDGLMAQKVQEQEVALTLAESDVESVQGPDRLARADEGEGLRLRGPDRQRRGGADEGGERRQEGPLGARELPTVRGPEGDPNAGGPGRVVPRRPDLLPAARHPFRRAAGLLQGDGRPLHDQGPARRVRHLRPGPVLGERPPDRGGVAGPPGSGPLLPAGPLEDASRGDAPRVDHGAGQAGDDRPVEDRGTGQPDDRGACRGGRAAARPDVRAGSTTSSRSRPRSPWTRRPAASARR